MDIMFASPHNMALSTLEMWASQIILILSTNRCNFKFFGSVLLIVQYGPKGNSWVMIHNYLRNTVKDEDSGQHANAYKVSNY